MRRRPRGSGTIIRERSGWAVRYGPRNASTYEGGFRTKAEAENRLTIIRAERMNRRLGIAADPRRTPTLGELADPWLARRKLTHAAGKLDGYRWGKHLEPHVGHLRPHEVDVARIRTIVESKIGAMSPLTVRVNIALLSSLYEDLLERGLATVNPARHLPKSLLHLMRPPAREVAFIHRMEDVTRIVLALAEPYNVAYAIGVYAGLRTAEVRLLEWHSVDLQARRIVVQAGGVRGTKDLETRSVPILDPLLALLKLWRLRHQGPGRVIPAQHGEQMDPRTPPRVLRPVLRRFGLHEVAAERKAWYAATRHTFASQWAMAGGSVQELQKVMGHSDITDTMRYAKLAPGFFSANVYGLLGGPAPQPGSVAQISTDGPRNMPKPQSGPL